MRLKIIPSLIALLSLIGLATKVRADNFIQVSQFRPADTTEPAYREDGGSRALTVVEGGSGLIALTPVTGGVTVAEYPTLLVLSVSRSDDAIETVMGLKDDADNVVYETTIQLPTEDSIIAINLKQDEDSVPLETNKTYRWYIYSGFYYTEVPITRTNLDSEFAQTLEQANLQERFNLYKKQGIWYEALHTLFELRRAKPNDQTLIQEWQELLQFVGL
ncbi:MAG: DUF928 domain-containing protein, partial [Cyanobacteriota bacterium]|nr:DUF928 domain-containing protein [Cyanobacteriota bacterium]